MAQTATHTLAHPDTGAVIEVRIETLVLSHFFSNCYLIALPAAGRALVIDPAEAPPVAHRLQQRGWTATAILCTHGHLDHAGGARALARLTGAPVAIHPEDEGYLGNVELAAETGFTIEPGSPDRLLKDGDDIALESDDGARLVLRVIHTPGHSPGSVTLVAGGSPGPGFCFDGDCLFAGSVGRTDFPGGSAPALMRSIRDRLLALPDETVVYPGHGPPTTIGQERRTNPFLTGQFELR